MSSTLQRRFDRALAVLGTALVVATGVVLLTSGGQDDDDAAAPQAAPAASVDRVGIKDFKFAPAAITVPVGTTITWTNADNAPHTATSGMSPTPDGAFDSGTITKGAREKVTVRKRGTYAYYCALHPFMKATVIVE